MRRSKAFQLVIVVALLTALGPLLAALYLARTQGMETELARVTGYARDVVDRSDRAVAQMQDAIAILAAANRGEPCSDAMIVLMQDLGLRSEYMKVAGHVSGDRLLCSTMGHHGEGLQLGPIDIITPNRTTLREVAPLPFARDIPYISLERDGFIAMTHRSQAIDLVVDQEGVLFATFNPQTGIIRTASGELDPRWVSSVDNATLAAFVDGGYIVGVVRSDQVSQTGAIAAVPVRYLNDRVREFILLLVPIALITGACLTASFLYLARSQSSLSSQIRQGIKRKEFFLRYQPIVDLGSGRWTGVEALLRWRRRDGEIVYPDAFIPIAEQTGIINQLTTEVIRMAGQDIGDLLAEYPDFTLSINLSARDLQSSQTLTALLDMKRNTGARSGQLTVELTERMLVDQNAGRRLIQALHGEGIDIAIDDFGTGYSSLSYMETLQFDAIKIDRLFVEAIDTEAATNKVVSHIIEMAARLGLKVVAEGVETVSQAMYLRDHGVAFAQGWLYSKAVPADELRQYLARRPEPAVIQAQPLS